MFALRCSEVAVVCCIASIVQSGRAALTSPRQLDTAKLQDPQWLNSPRNTHTKNRRCTVATGDLNDTMTSVRNPESQVPRLTMVRRHAGEQECDFGGQTAINELLQSSSESRHTLPLLGGLTVEWTGSNERQEMLILCEVAAETLTASGLPSNMFLSSDYGITFVNAPMQEYITDALFSETSFSSGPNEGHFMAYALPNPTETTGGLRLWASADTGSNFVKLDLSSVSGLSENFEALYPHPTRPDWFLATTTHDHAFVCTNVAAVVNSGGSSAPTCTHLGENVVNIAWSVYGAAHDLIYFTMKDSLTNVDDLSFVRWENVPTASGKKVVMSKVDNFQEQNQYVFLTDIPTENTHWESTLWVSSDLGATFAAAQFPFEGRNNHFSIVDASEDFVFVCVDHNKTRDQGTITLNGYPSDDTKQPWNVSAFRALFSEVVPPEGTPLARMVFDTSNEVGCTDTGGISIHNVKGNYLVVRRGACKFFEKAVLAQSLGAIGLIVINTVDSHELYMMAPEGMSLDNMTVLVVSSSDGQILLNQINQDPLQQVSATEADVSETFLYRTSHLYASDASGLKYSVSLKNVMYEADSSDVMGGGYTDVYKVESMNGTYLANSRSREGLVSTVITYDKGAYWWSVTPPEDLRSCRDEVAEDDCRMNLVLESDNIITGHPMPLSTPTAVGIIIANAWIDNGYMPDPFTVMSRDGGLTWHQIENSQDDTHVYFPHMYRILDHGAVILFVPHRRATSTLAFALDEARNGEVMQYDFLSSVGITDPVIVQGVVTEPGGATTAMFLYYVSDEMKWEGLKLDFNAVLGTNCNQNDYENWSPMTLSPQPSCILGQTVTYRRRQPCKKCLNTRGEFVSRQVQDCKCANQDFRCTMGLFRPNNIDATNVECIPDEEYSLPVCTNGNKAVRYELLPGDTCTDATTSGFLDAVKTRCKQSETLAEEVGKALGYFIAAGLIVVLLLAFVFTFSPDARERAINVFGTEGKVGKFLSRFSCFRHDESYVYSKLTNQTEKLFEEDSEESDDDDGLGLYDDDMKDAKETGRDTEDDEMLFTMSDNFTATGLPIADYSL
eukprot:m.1086951 g.1086951  ORF g.1086951 m.1086951 type:complete len:1069 (+) comp24281_c0_seq2:199-3405(+)